ncbi:hypothetical protein [Hoeflea sp. TYP-13]|uniref:hypothetical protein n=1 Tax=Hoeflea sp. TYP-13 TaxID=3230023 RepID=UPI0034C6A602
MYAPKEAQADFGLYWIAVAVLVIISASAVLSISFQNGLTYFMIQQSSAELTGVVIDRDINAVTYTYTDATGREATARYVENSLTDQPVRVGQAVILAYNPRFPEYIYPKSQLEFIEYDYYFALASIAAILIALLVAALAFVLHIRFIIRMRNY